MNEIKILVIEDEPQLASLLKKGLEDFSFHFSLGEHVDSIVSSWE